MATAASVSQMSVPPFVLQSTWCISGSDIEFISHGLLRQLFETKTGTIVSNSSIFLWYTLCSPGLRYIEYALSANGTHSLSLPPTTSVPELAPNVSLPQGDHLRRRPTYWLVQYEYVCMPLNLPDSELPQRINATSYNMFLSERH